MTPKKIFLKAQDEFLNLILSQGMTEQKLWSLLEDSVTEHGHQCLHNPEFSITSGMEGETNLLMSCPVSLNCQGSLKSIPTLLCFSM